MKPVHAIVAGSLTLIAIVGAAYLIDPVPAEWNRLPDVSIGIQQGPVPVSDPPSISVTGELARGSILGNDG